MKYNPRQLECNICVKSKEACNLYFRKMPNCGIYSGVAIIVRCSQYVEKVK